MTASGHHKGEKQHEKTAYQIERGHEKISSGRINSRKALFLESSTNNNNSETESNSGVCEL